MSDANANALVRAADIKRRELPASIALLILIGGLAAAIMGGAMSVLWAGVMAALLIADAEIHRRLEVANRDLDQRALTALALWGGVCAAVFTLLPITLWRHGEAAGAAAAMVLWSAGVVRAFNGSAPRAWMAFASAAPPALGLVLTPLAFALTSPQADWDLALIAIAGGGALTAYVVHAQVNAANAAREFGQQAEALHLSDRIGRHLFEQATMPAMLLDRQGRIMSGSRNARVEGSPLVGRSFTDLCNWRSPRWDNAFKRALEGEGVTIDEEALDTPAGRRYFNWRADPFRDASGEIVGVLTTAYDITNFVETRQAAADSAQRMRAALEAGRSVMQHADERLRRTRQLCAAGEVSAASAPAPVAEDSVDDVAAMITRIGALITEMDTTDEVLAETIASLRLMREAADAASVSKSQFLASMSHELRTPLNAIIGYSEILKEEAEADGRDGDIKDIDRVLSSARQLLHLINGILDLSKIEAGRMDLSCSEFSVTELLHEAVATMAPAIANNGNKVRVIAGAGVGMMQSDPFKLTQCVLNLLANAAKFTSGGEIVLEARREADAHGADWISIAVRDTGIGMTPEQMGRVFDTFKQADAATAAKYGGTGLGLAITQRLLNLLGGDVTVTSVHGEGSTFTARVPVTIEDHDSIAPKDGRGGLIDGRGCTALVIDDQESARDLAARALTRLGFVVRQASVGRSGLELARALQPNVILLDINLPDMSGWEVLSALRAGATKDIPVIIHSVDDNRQRAIASGACELIRKPADRDVLAAAALRFIRLPNPNPQPVAMPRAASA